MLLTLGNAGSIHVGLMWAASFGRSVSIAVTGMLIVACALVLICLFIMSLPRLLAAIATFWPESDEPHGGSTHPESLVPDDEEVVAAIGYVLHHRLHSQPSGSQTSAQAS